MKDRIDRLFLKMTLALLAMPCSLAYGTDGDGGDNIGDVFLGNSLDASTAAPDTLAEFGGPFGLGIALTSLGDNPFS